MDFSRCSPIVTTGHNVAAPKPHPSLSGMQKRGGGVLMGGGRAA